MIFEVEELPHKFLQRKGDDLYFVCWDTTVLSFLTATPVVEEPLEPKNNETGHPQSENGNGIEADDWLARGQQVLIQNAQEENDLCHLQGKLYTLSEQLAHKAVFLSIMESTILTAIFLLIGPNLAVALTRDAVLQHLFNDLVPMNALANIAMSLAQIFSTCSLWLGCRA